MNFCFAILQKDAVRYIPWERCTSRRDEINDPKFEEDPGLKLAADGTFVQSNHVGSGADLSSELRWEDALRRRALAMDMSGLCAYDVADLWHEKLRRAFLAPVVPGRAKISLSQLLLADKALFVYIGEQLATSDLGVSAGEVVTQFQKAWVEGTLAQEVCVHLQPLPLGGPPDHVQTGQPSSTGSVLAALERTIQSHADQIKILTQNKKRTPPDSELVPVRNKSQRNGDINTRYPAVFPADFRRTTDGNQKICWNFNLPHGCQDAEPGQSCSRGFHVCVVCPGDVAHSFQSH